MLLKGYDDMFKRILVPLDGSSRAEQVIPVAARIARATDGTIVMLQALNPPVDFMPYQVPIPVPSPQLIDAELEKAEEYLESVKGAGSLVGVHVETAVVLGQPASVILAEAGKRQLDLIALCSHGYTGMTRWLLGSVAEKVARHATVPTLILREGGSAPVGIRAGAVNLLVPLDGSELAEASILPAAHLAAALSASERGMLHLLQVVILPGGEQNKVSGRDEILRAAQQYIRATVERVRGIFTSEKINVAVTGSVTIDDDIASAIARVAECGEKTEDGEGCERSDIIAMATHGRGGLQLWTMGSVTERVLQATNLPLLIVRPAEPSAPPLCCQGYLMFGKKRGCQGQSPLTGARGVLRPPFFPPRRRRGKRKIK